MVVGVSKGESRARTPCPPTNDSFISGFIFSDPPAPRASHAKALKSEGARGRRRGRGGGRGRGGARSKESRKPREKIGASDLINRHHTTISVCSYLMNGHLSEHIAVVVAARLIRQNMRHRQQRPSAKPCNFPRIFRNFAHIQLVASLRPHTSVA